MEILTNIKMWLSAKRKAHRERKAAQKAAALVREAWLKWKEKEAEHEPRR